MNCLFVLSALIARIVYFVVAISPIVLAGCGAPATEFNYDLDVLGTSAHIVIEGLPAKEAHKAALVIANDLEQLDHIGYTFAPASELYKLNEAISRGQSITVSAALKGLIEEASTLYSMSEGLFNPAAGELTALWEYHCDKTDCTQSPYLEEVQHLIDERESEIILQNPSMDDLIFEGNRVSSRRPVVKLEFGDMIRGFALDMGIAHLKQMHIDNAMIFIGSGVATLGTREGEPWWIGLPLHSKVERMVGTIESTGDKAVVTVHAFDKSIGKRDSVYRHVVDPRSGLPVKETQSVTVIHDSATTANAAAAALLVNGREGWASVAEKMGVQLVMMITQDGAIYTSPMLEKRIQWKPNLEHKSLLP